MLRILLLLIACAAAAVWVEPQWDREARALTLRLRSPEELGRLVRAQSRALGERAVEELQERLATSADGAGEPSKLPAVSTAPPAKPSSEVDGERIDYADQQRLDRLIEEKLREE